MTLPNFWELKLSMIKLGAFPDGIQWNESDAKQLSFAKFEDKDWEIPNRKGFEYIPRFLKFPLAKLENQVNVLC